VDLDTIPFEQTGACVGGLEYSDLSPAGALGCWRWLIRSASFRLRWTREEETVSASREASLALSGFEGSAEAQASPLGQKAPLSRDVRLPAHANTAFSTAPAPGVGEEELGDVRCW